MSQKLIDAEDEKTKKEGEVLNSHRQMEDSTTRCQALALENNELEEQIQLQKEKLSLLQDQMAKSLEEINVR